jgi:orotidine-5'-phosphate decarboxylase
MTALEKLRLANLSGKFICVGLDTDIEKIPSFLSTRINPVLEFNEKIIRATSEYTAAYKLNFAFYERLGPPGLEIIAETLNCIPRNILTIGDAKRGDIGNTSKMYAGSILEEFNFDSVTVNPYMGEDSVKPFLDYKNKLIFILALTSNPGSMDFEKLYLADGKQLFQRVIEKVKQWNKGNCGIVFGATNTAELIENINLIEDLPVLLPGVGAQGGDLEEVGRVFKKQGRQDFLVNVSRGIIYKSSSENFSDQAREELLKLNNLVSKVVNI